MKRSLLVNVVLALLVLGLGLWMTLKPGDKGPEDFPLSAQKPSEVDRISIRRPGLPEFVLEKHEGAWRQSAPFAARAESSQTGRLLDLLAARSTQKLPATDLARFELDKPFATVTLGKDTFAFGTVNTLTSEQYVLSGDAVYLVSPVFGYGLPTREDSLASHRLLGDDEVPVGVEAPGATLAQKDGKLTLTRADGANAEAPSQDDLSRWLEGWRYASALTTQIAKDIPSGEPLRVMLKGDRKIEFVIVARAPDVKLFRRDENMLFTLSKEQGTQLLALPGRRP
jgi:hypothetical protein